MVRYNRFGQIDCDKHKYSDGFLEILSLDFLKSSLVTLQTCSVTIGAPTWAKILAFSRVLCVKEMEIPSAP